MQGRRGESPADHQDADDGTPKETTGASVNHKQTFIKRRNRIILCMCLFLLILSMAYTSTDRGKIHVETRVMATTNSTWGAKSRKISIASFIFMDFIILELVFFERQFTIVWGMTRHRCTNIHVGPKTKDSTFNKCIHHFTHEPSSIQWQTLQACITALKCCPSSLARREHSCFNNGLATGT